MWIDYYIQESRVQTSAVQQLFMHGSIPRYPLEATRTLNQCVCSDRSRRYPETTIRSGCAVYAVFC